MSKYTDIATVRRILRDGFVLPEQVEQFFIDAKAKAIASVFAARKRYDAMLDDLYKHGKEQFEKLSDTDKTFFKEQYIRGDGWVRKADVMTYDDWKCRERNKIIKNYPYWGIKDDKAKQMMEEDCDMKRIHFIIKVHGIVGDNIQGSDLHIDDESGDVNGMIWSDKGKASVKTIGAGGYNIQCYHFRCLVREIVR